MYATTFKFKIDIISETQWIALILINLAKS